MPQNQAEYFLSVEAYRRLTHEVELRALDSTGAEMLAPKYLMPVRHRMLLALVGSNER